MKIHKVSQEGFTIIEIMIFLAISGVVFMFGIGSLLNTQSKDQFIVSLNTIKNELQMYLNNSANGNYQLPSGYSCVQGSGRLQISTAPSNNTSICSYLGSGLLFIRNNGSALDQIDTLPIFGYTFANNNGFNQSQPNSTYLYQSLPISDANLVSTYYMPASIKIYSVSFVNTANNGSLLEQTNLFLLLNNFNQYTTSSLLDSGSQFSEIIPIIPKIPVTASPVNQAVAYINELTDKCSGNLANQPVLYSCRYSGSAYMPGSDTSINPSSGVSVCLNNTNASESADLTIGGSNSSSNKTIFTKLYNKQDCQ